jgi:hypothetical protein
MNSSPLQSLPIGSQFDEPDLPNSPTYILRPALPIAGSPSLLRPSIALTVGTGILTRFPSITHLCLTLGADSPYSD